MTTETLEKFYMRKLPELRRKRDVTRKEVAQGVGVTLGKYDKWETGKVLPKAGDVDRLAEYYGISIDGCWRLRRRKVLPSTGRLLRMRSICRRSNGKMC